MSELGPTGDQHIKNALTGYNERHRLCFDFSNAATLQEFFGKCKRDGITHPDSIPILMFDDNNTTIWVVGRNNPTKNNPDGTLIQRP